MNSETITIPRGDTDSFYSYLADITTGTPVIVDITGYKLICSIKTQYELPDENVVIPQIEQTISATSGAGTVGSSSTTVTGSETSFTTAVQAGDLILSGTQLRIVASVTSNTVLVTKGLPSPDDVSVTLNDSFSPALSSATYKILRPQISFSAVNTDIAFGKYVYDIRWVSPIGVVTTTNVGQFVISKNVTRKNT